MLLNIGLLLKTALLGFSKKLLFALDLYKKKSQNMFGLLST